MTAVCSALRAAGYLAVSAAEIAEGSNHYVYDVTLENGAQVICKFAKVRDTEKGLTAPWTRSLAAGSPWTGSPSCWASPEPRASSLSPGSTGPTTPP